MKAIISFFVPLLFTVHTFALDPPKDLNVGIYVSYGTNWTQLPVEIVDWKRDGVLKNSFTDGIVKGDLNGRIPGSESPVAMSATSNAEIFLRTVDEGSAEDYQLLRLRKNSDAREFRSVTGGVPHVSGSATRGRIPFAARNVGPHLWRIALVDLPNGEYGFLPPVNASNFAASGRIYSFQVSPAPKNLYDRSFIKSVLWPAGDKEWPDSTSNRMDVGTVLLKR